MILFAALLVPIIIAIILFVFLKYETSWWEFLLPFATALIVAGIFKLAVEKSATSDDEYWTGYVVNAQYYESWNEWIHKTCSKQVSNGRDSKGNTKYRTVYYDCSYCQEHPAYWIITDNNGIQLSVSETKYKKLVSKFGNEHPVDMHRHYYTRDGDMFQTDFPNNNDLLECVVTEHSYENRVQAARDVFNFEEVDTADIREYGLYQYPVVNGYTQRNLIGNIKDSNYLNRKLEILNARLGNKKQVKVFVLLFRNKTRESGHYQEALWKGGNKNELVVCIGLDNNDNVSWCYPFTWCENQILKVNTRTHFEEEKKLDLNKGIDYLYTEVDTNFKRKHFKEFSYLTVEPSTAEIIWTFVITILVNIGVVYWIITNKSNPEDPYGTFNNNYRY